MDEEGLEMNDEHGRDLDPEVEAQIQQMSEVIIELQNWIQEIGEPAVENQKHLEQQIDDMTEENAEKQEDMQREIQKAHIESEKYKGENAQLTKTISSLKADKETMEEQMSALRTSGSREGANKRMEQEVTAVKRQLKNKEQELSQQSDSITKMAGTIGAMQQQKLEMEHERDKHRAKTKAVEKKLQKVHKEYKEKIRILERENTEFNQTIIDMEMELNKVRDQVMADLQNAMEHRTKSEDGAISPQSETSDVLSERRGSHSKEPKSPDHHRRTSSLSLLPKSVQQHMRKHSRNLSRTGHMRNPSVTTHQRNLSRKLANMNEVFGKTASQNNQKLTTEISELLENFCNQQLPLALNAETARILEEMDSMKTELQMMRASIGKNIRESMKDSSRQYGGAGDDAVPGAPNGPSDDFVKAKIDSLRHINNHFEKMRTYIRTLEYSRQQDVKTFKQRMETPGQTPGGPLSGLFGNTMR